MLRRDVNISRKTLDCPSFNTKKTNCSQSVSNEVSLDVCSIQNVSSLETGIFLRDTFHRPTWSNDKIKDSHALCLKNNQPLPFDVCVCSIRLLPTLMSMRRKC